VSLLISSLIIYLKQQKNRKYERLDKCKKITK
jgi:hypothetical protein